MLELLSKLPYLLTIWTSICLCWGLYLTTQMCKCVVLSNIKPQNAVTLGFTVLANILLLMYLFFEPQIANTFGDAIVVINVFYTAFLITMSYNMSDKSTP